MLTNLVPEFLEVLRSSDRVSAYLDYFERHASLLEPYWSNYVLPGDSPANPHFFDVIRSTVTADRADLIALLEHTDLEDLALGAGSRAADLLGLDSNAEIVLMVGVGAANAGELVIHGKGVAFICVEHFTATRNKETHGLGLSPDLIPLWVAHEMAHVVRYTSPLSRSELRRLIDDSGGDYSYWETGRRTSLRELIVNEGLAVQVARAVSPGHPEWEYLGYGRRQYARVAELAPVISQAIEPDLGGSALGLRLRYLSGGMSVGARTVDGNVLPERSGYYIGSQMVEYAIAEKGWQWAIRASAEEITAIAREATFPALRIAESA